MKLSEFDTDEIADILCELVPHIDSILTDKELMKEIKSVIGFNVENFKDNAELISFGVKRVTKVIPYLLKEKKDDVFAILAITEKKAVEEIGKQNIMVTMKQIQEKVQDKKLVAFFKSWADTEGNE